LAGTRIRGEGRVYKKGKPPEGKRSDRFCFSRPGGLVKGVIRRKRRKTNTARERELHEVA